VSPALVNKLRSAHPFYTLQYNNRLLLVLETVAGEPVEVLPGYPVGYVSRATTAEVMEEAAAEERRADMSKRRREEEVDKMAEAQGERGSNKRRKSKEEKDTPTELESRKKICHSSSHSSTQSEAAENGVSHEISGTLRASVASSTVPSAAAAGPLPSTSQAVLCVSGPVACTSHSIPAVQSTSHSVSSVSITSRDALTVPRTSHSVAAVAGLVPSTSHAVPAVLNTSHAVPAVSITSHAIPAVASNSHAIPAISGPVPSSSHAVPAVPCSSPAVPTVPSPSCTDAMEVDTLAKKIQRQDPDVRVLASAADKLMNTTEAGAGAPHASCRGIVCLDVETISDGEYTQFTQIGAVLSLKGEVFDFYAQVGESSGTSRNCWQRFCTPSNGFFAKGTPEICLKT